MEMETRTTGSMRIETMVVASLCVVTAASPTTANIRAAQPTSRIALSRCLDDYCGLFVMDADGSNGRFLTLTPSSVVGESLGSWSPDGTQLVVESGRDCAPESGDPCLNDLYVVNVDGSGMTRLTNTVDVAEEQPAWSPDGRRIAFGAAVHDINHDLVGEDIYVMNADGTNVMLLASAPTGGAAFAPAWSPDGTKILYSVMLDSNFAIYMANTDGSAPVRLSAPSKSAGDIGGSWSPDGTKIAFTRLWLPSGNEDGTYCQVFVMNADGSNPVQLTNDPFCANNPSWSPDGTKIALLDTVGRFGLGISTLNLDGSEGATLVVSGGFGSPVWSPPGSVPPLR